MSDVIISAENIGKCYTLDHQTGGGGYRKFSDTLISTAKAPLRWLKAVSGERQAVSSKEEFWALNDVSFEIKRGEVVGIVGRNGAGKSTLLKILSRITEPTKGRITLDGRVASLLEVGTGFHPELSGRENIYLNGAILGMRKEEIRCKFDEIVAFAEIEKFLDTPVKRYSSGMYVRLAFAVAAHLEPEILIVDEVLAVGDSQFQAKCLGKMKDVASGGRTVLFVSHNMAAVNALCSTGILLSQGRVEQRGEVSDVITQYVRQGHQASEFQPNTGAVAHITHCEVEAEDGSPLTNGFTNQSLVIKFGYRSREGIRGLRTGFTILLADGTALAVCTPEDEGEITPGSAGEHEMRVCVPPNQLMRGTYQISAAMWNGISGEIYDKVSGVCSFHLEAAKGRAYSSEFQRAGLVQLPVRWSF